MTTTQELAEQIERLVREHITAIRISATTAVMRAFAAANSVVAGHPVRRAKVVRAPRAKPAPRRAVEEVAALADQFYASLCQSPGETMATLAPRVGASPRALHVAVALLKRAGRVRTVGERRFTRYFPMMKAANATATA